MTPIRCLTRSHPLLVLFAAATVCAAELKVDLRNERVGRPPTTFEPMTATGSVLRPPLAGNVGLWSKTDSTSYFKDYVVSAR